MGDHRLDPAPTLESLGFSRGVKQPLRKLGWSTWIVHAGAGEGLGLLVCQSTGIVGVGSNDPNPGPGGAGFLPRSPTLESLGFFGGAVRKSLNVGVGS